MIEKRFVKKEAIDKGWSGDTKFRVTTVEGISYLLRISPADRAEAKRADFERMKHVEALGIPMCRPIAFDTDPDGAYSLQSWIDGVDGEVAVPLLSDTEQYVMGLEAGRILRTIHTIPAPPGQESWESRYNRKVDRNIRNYQACPVHFDGAARLIRYLEANRELLRDRPQSYQHGDYHVGNLMVDHSGKLVVIDFDRSDYGDPWEEFNRIVFCVHVSPLFTSGMVNGYFDGQVPPLFWRLLALYIASNTLASVPWALPYGQSDVDTMLDRARDVLSWYGDFHDPVPSWYHPGYYLQEIDGVPYKLKAPFDFGFLSRFGTVFKVYDDQDSGNICFGIQSVGERLFVKFAGAPTEQYDGTAADAVARLRAACRVYEDLAHPNLIRLIRTEPCSGGLASVFEWVDAVCMGRMYPASRKAFHLLPQADKLHIFEDILSFHAHVAACGYVAVDFYDGCVLYDTAHQKTMICDVDLYEKKPHTNQVGRMWGSARFMSPEEHTLGAVIDEVTNVYTMGATAFALFGEDGKRTPEAWTLSRAHYDVAAIAASDVRDRRYPSIQAMIRAWKAAWGASRPT
jgi:serine/threonine-protein kinase